MNNYFIKTIVITSIIFNIVVLSYATTLFEKTKKSAENGKSNKQVELAQMYLQGNGVEKNIKEAIIWYKKATEQKNSEAQYALAEIYFSGKEVEQNLTEAFKFYKQSAENKNKKAYFNLAELYYSGDGGEKNLHEALKYYLQTKELQNAEIQCKIAKIYKELEDEKQAINWYTKAAKQNNSEALFNLGQLYDNKYSKGYMTDSEYNLSQKRQQVIIKYYEPAVEQGSFEAIAKLDDYTKQVMYYEKFANKGNVEAMLKTADRLFKIKRYGDAIAWYKRAFDNGEQKVSINLGSAYKELGNYDKSVEWYELSFTNGNNESAFELGNLYEEMGIYSKALEWYSKSSKTSHFDFARVYRKQNNYKKAITIYEKAFSNGETIATYELTRLYLDTKNNDKALEWYNKAKEALVDTSDIDDIIYPIKKAKEDYKAKMRGAKKSVRGQWFSPEDLSQYDIKSFISEDNYNNIANYIKNGRIQRIGQVSVVLMPSEYYSLGFSDALIANDNYVEIIYDYKVLGDSPIGRADQILKRNFYRASKSDIAYWNKINKLFAK